MEGRPVNRNGLHRLYGRVADQLLGLIASDCRLCGARATAPDALCEPCTTALPWLSPGCPRCAAPGAANRPCGRCLTRPPAFDRAVAAFRYAAEIGPLVRGFKLHGDLAAGRLLADALARHVTDDLPPALVPMPLHPTHRRRRGFNQAAEIARRLPGRVHHGLVGRVTGVTPQRGLRERERRRNVRGVFRVTAATVPERLTIVDDVITTAATVNELAACLRRAGAREVVVCALARAGR